MPSSKLLITVAFASFLPATSRADTPPATEARACCGLTAADADLPLRSDVIESVDPIYRNTRSGRRLLGAEIVYRSGLGLTAERLQAALECQAARGREHPSADSPLAVRWVETHVRSEGDRLRVELTSDRAASANEILERGRRLAAFTRR